MSAVGGLAEREGGSNLRRPPSGFVLLRFEAVRARIIVVVAEAALLQPARGPAATALYLALTMSFGDMNSALAL